MVLPYLKGFLHLGVILVWMNFGYSVVKGLCFISKFATSSIIALSWAKRVFSSSFCWFSKGKKEDGIIMSNLLNNMCKI